MPTPLKFKAPFRAESFYHIVCKSIDGILLFMHPQDYRIFKQKFQRFNAPFFQVWSYSLLSNHTHHIIKVASLNTIINYLVGEQQPQKTVAMTSFLQEPENERLLDQMLERQMNSFLVSYANYYNDRYNRRGGLFQKPFRRIEISDDGYLQQAIIYTNANAQKHKIVEAFFTYPHCSYPYLLNDQDTWIAKAEVLNFFGGRRKFEELHKAQVEYYYQNGWPSSRLE